ncbi:hypothetical protein FKW77_008670 [Venturia effusa]|uniref:Uncharacterized protein n=1 Tax=Venturia effusa TaxID=50376 RepID=A0A517LBF8_9PEZI|nr:hypothetical protein FKW77_008670 [Venturia effusa]
MTALIANMERLEHVVLTDRGQVSEIMGVDLPHELYDRSKKQQRSNTWQFFLVLACGLSASGRSLKTLAMYNLNALDLGAFASTKHAFIGITKLSLSISDNSLILRDQTTLQTRSLTDLLEHAAPGLQFLSLNFNWQHHRAHTWHPPSLGAVFARPAPTTPTGIPLVFPRLLELKFRLFSMDTLALTTFLRHQPVLREATFDAVLLSGPGSTWNDVASALPHSATSWQVRNVSQPKRNRADQCYTWNPLVEILDSASGWEWDMADFLRQHQLNATTMTQLSADRLTYLKSRRRFSTIKFTRAARIAEV